MHVEVSVALNFVISYLYNKMPRRRVDMFAEELEKGLKRRFEGHWYPDKPLKGTAFRCIKVSGDKADPVIAEAARQCGLDINEIYQYIPDELTIWIDPNEVSYRIGEKGIVKILYSDKRADDLIDHLDREIQAASRGFNPEAQCFRPIDSLSSSLSHLSLSPSSPNPSNGWTSPSGSFTSQSPVNANTNANAVYLPKSNSTPNFTAATFAQTKFGSTKLKTMIKRPSRLSPTEVGAYVSKQQRVNGVAVQAQNRPRSLSPRHPRHSYFDQSQMLFPGQQPAPLNGMVGEFYSPVNQPFSFGFPEMMQGPGGPVMNTMPSPEGAKAFTDGLSFSTLPYQNQIQHLLVAN
ncbi:protein Tob1-like [Lineus longissimus]|uniref:protein Tob1-like n=1 Tax=Lineus longissimus TaxID=88925 RepID=UPI00315CB895